MRGAGVHTGIAYVGAVGSDSVADFTVLGETVNVTARLASLADAGEAVISEAAHTASRSDLGNLDRRELSLRGRDAPMLRTPVARWPEDLDRHPLGVVRVSTRSSAMSAPASARRRVAPEDPPLQPRP